MSCTSPIDIVPNLVTGKCDLKCDYIPNYDFTTVTASNNGDHILYTFGETSSYTSFNTQLYTPNNMILYSPGLHSYSGTKSKAELLISHTHANSSDHLIVCIPIDIGESLEETIMDSLISQVAIRAPSEGGTTIIHSPSFTISKLVPTKPYYNYTGTAFFESNCDKMANYIVFPAEYAIKITSQSMKKLTDITIENDYSIKENSDGYFYNANGPRQSSNSSDDIYIDCQPTGDQGKTTIYEPAYSRKSDSINVTDFFLNTWWLVILVACIIIVMAYSIPKAAFKLSS